MSQAASQSFVASRLAAFGTTIFTEMTLLAQKHGAVNLAQGFPDFDGPEFVKDAAVRAIAAGESQYARMFGIPALNRAIADAWSRRTGESIDPDTQVTVTSGCTEAIAAALLGLINPGDEVVLFEPYYDSYRACVEMAGGVARFVTLVPAGDPDAGFAFDPEQLRRAFTPRTRALLLNSPHNPTGKVFTRPELAMIAELCVRRGAIAITDEVYERLTFELARPHISLGTLPGMAERTVTLSSLGKTFSLTGWKVGWAVATPALSKAVRAAHQFLTFATCTPMQHAAAAAIMHGEEYVQQLVEQYRSSRDFLSGVLRGIGFKVYPCEGTYFIMADHAAFGMGDDVSFCRRLTAEVGVAAIPPSVFYDNPDNGRRLARFAFCKRRETLEKAAERLANLRG